MKNFPNFFQQSKCFDFSKIFVHGNEILLQFSLTYFCDCRKSKPTRRRAQCW